jgi:hypothetical protein
VSAQAWLRTRVFRLSLAESQTEKDSMAEREGIRTLGTGYPVRQISNVAAVRERRHLSKTPQDSIPHWKDDLVARQRSHPISPNLIQAGTMSSPWPHPNGLGGWELTPNQKELSAPVISSSGPQGGWVSWTLNPLDQSLTTLSPKLLAE